MKTWSRTIHRVQLDENSTAFLELDGKFLRVMNNGARVTLNNVPIPTLIEGLSRLYKLADEGGADS